MLEGLRPDILAEPSTIVFGDAFVGITHRRVVRVRNVGEARLEISSVRLREDSHPDLFVTDEAFVLDTSESRDVEVRFAPSALGPAHGAVLIASNDPDESVVEVPIEAEGLQRPGPVLSVCVESADVGLPRQCADPLRVDFGRVPFGEARRATITIASIGTLPIEILSASAQPDAHPSIDFDPATLRDILAVQSSRTIEVAFSPAVPEEVSAVFRIESNDEARSFVPIIVTGSGITPALCAIPSAVDFGAVALGGFAERTVTLESCGEAPVDIRALELGTNPEFSIPNSPMSPQTLPPGARVDVVLRYSPTDAGSDQDRLRVVSSLPDTIVPLAGRAATCDIVVTPLLVNFGGVSINGSRQRSVLVQNNGDASCTVNAIALTSGTSSEFSLVSPPATPASLAPAISMTIAVEYRPADTGSDTGRLRITNTDPAEPSIDVSLEGRRLGLGECALEAQPDPVTFGAVALGATQSISVQIRNTGGSLCTITRADLSPSGPRDFQAVPDTFPWLIPANGTHDIEVRFTPRSTGPQSTELRIFAALIPIVPDLVLSVSGSGSGPRLCPVPNPVVFGTHAIGIPASQQLLLASCGTEPVLVSSLELPLPTSSEFSIATPPVLPLTIPAGTSAALNVLHMPFDAGRDDGTLRIASSDALSPVHDVQLIASVGSGCGDIQGKICDLTGSGPLAGARVSIDTPSGRLEATTNMSGDFVVTCVPPGTWTVVAEHGSWSTSFQGASVDGQVTVIPGSQCLDPDSAEVAVVWGEWDHVETVLGDLGIPYTFYGEPNSSRAAADLIEDAGELARYDIVFLNCGWAETIGLDSPGIDNLRNFVALGGSLYSSDYGYDVLEYGWPSYIDYFGDDAVYGAAETAGVFNGLARVADPSLVAGLGSRTEVHVQSPATGMMGISGGTVYLEGDRYSDGTLHPLMAGFRPSAGSGLVVYTDFHNIGSLDINDIFRWLMSQL